jgi:hypothetical protein
MLVKTKKDSAYLHCYHNTDYTIEVSQKQQVFVIDSDRYPVGKYEVALYHPSFDFQSVYIGNREDWDVR